MKLRYLSIYGFLFSFCAMNAYAFVVSDPLNFGAQVEGRSEEIKNTKEVIEVKNFADKTNSAIGSAKNSVSKLQNNTVGRAAAIKAKADEIKARAEKRKAEFDKKKKELEAKKAEFEDYKKQFNEGVSDVKSAVSDIKEVAGSAKDIANSKINEAKDKAGIKDSGSGGSSTNQSSGIATSDNKDYGEPSKPTRETFDVVKPSNTIKDIKPATNIKQPTIFDNNETLVRDDFTLSEEDEYVPGAIREDVINSYDNVNTSKEISKYPQESIRDENGKLIPADRYPTVDEGGNIIPSDKLPNESNNTKPAVEQPAVDNAVKEPVVVKPSFSPSNSSVINNIKKGSGTTTQKKPARVPFSSLGTFNKTYAFSENISFAQLGLGDDEKTYNNEVNGEVLVPQSLVNFCEMDAEDLLNDDMLLECIIKIGSAITGPDPSAVEKARAEFDEIIAENFKINFALNLKELNDANQYVKVVDDLEEDIFPSKPDTQTAIMGTAVAKKEQLLLLNKKNKMMAVGNINGLLNAIKSFSAKDVENLKKLRDDKKSGLTSA